MILEAMKKPVSSGRKSNLAFETQGIDTAKSRVLRVVLLHRQIEAEMQAEIAELRTENTRLAAAYGREVLDHKATKNILTERETGLEFHQRIAESGGLMLSDRDDMLTLYRGRK